MSASSCARQLARVQSIASNRCVSCSSPILSARKIDGRAVRMKPSFTCRRSYATEAKVIPKSVLIRSPPPPAPTTQAQPPESATSLQYPSTRQDQIDGLLHHFHQSVFANDGSCARLPDLYDQLSLHAGRMVDHELPFQDTPQEQRRIPVVLNTDQSERFSWLDSCKLAEARLSSEHPAGSVEEDGLVLVAHVVDATPLPIMSWSLGFVINTKENYQYVVSCSHTLESVSQIL